MVQILHPTNKKAPSSLESIAGLLKQGTSEYDKYQSLKSEKNKEKSENASLKKRFNMDFEGYSPELKNTMVSEMLRGENVGKTAQAKSLLSGEKEKKQNREKVLNFDNAIESIDEMEKLIDKGNLGLGTG